MAYTVTPSSDNNGSISPSTPQLVATGSNLTFIATPNTGYVLNNWSVDGAVVQVGGDTSYTLTNITAAHTIRATFVHPLGFTESGQTSFYIARNSGTMTANGWATNIQGGRSLLLTGSGGPVKFLLTPVDPTLFTSTGQPAIDSSSGTLTFTPSPGVTGHTTVSVTLQNTDTNTTTTPISFTVWIVGVSVSVQPYIMLNNDEDNGTGIWDLNYNLQSIPREHDLAKVTLSVAPSDLDDGLFQLTTNDPSNSKIQLWTTMQKDEQLTEPIQWYTGDAIPSVYIEGIGNSNSLNDVQLTLQFIDTMNVVATATANTTITQVGLNIDTWNQDPTNDQFGNPHGAATSSRRGECGRSTFSSAKDCLRRQRRLGWRRRPGLRGMHGSRAFCTIDSNLPAECRPAKANIWICYSASDPNNMTNDSLGNPLPDTSGCLRLWQKNGIDTTRTLNDYIASNIYPASQFFSSGGEQVIWYVEAALLGENAQTTLPISYMWILPILIIFY